MTGTGTGSVEEEGEQVLASLLVEEGCQAASVGIGLGPASSSVLGASLWGGIGARVSRAGSKSNQILMSQKPGDRGRLYYSLGGNRGLRMQPCGRREA